MLINIIIRKISNLWVRNNGLDCVAKIHPFLNQLQNRVGLEQDQSSTS